MLKTNKAPEVLALHTLVAEQTGVFIKSFLAHRCAPRELYGVALSRISREMRREFGPTQTSRIFQTFANAQYETTETTVAVPDEEYRATEHQRDIWDLTGMLLRDLRKRFEARDMYNALLSYLSLEISREFGSREARTVLQGFADTQHEVTKYDR